MHYMETEEYRDFVYLMRDWYEKGYIAEDIATRADYNSYHNSGNTGMFYISYSPYAENTYNNSYKGDFVTIPVSPTVRSNKSMMGSLLGIYSKSEYVEECLQFLELLNTDPDMKNLVAYGIEGKHYNLVDGKVQKVAGANDLYKMDNYKCGNMMISYLVEGDPDDKYEQYKSFSEDAVDSPIIGFLPDTGEITNELAAISNVVSEYNSLLCVGAVDPDDYLDTMLEELKASGLDKVKEALQKQYDEWKK